MLLALDRQGALSRLAAEPNGASRAVDEGTLFNHLYARRLGYFFLLRAGSEPGLAPSGPAGLAFGD